MNDKYRVEYDMDDMYRVLELVTEEELYKGYSDVVVFNGTLSDCEAYIRLKEKGYM